MPSCRASEEGKRSMSAARGSLVLSEASTDQRAQFALSLRQAGFRVTETTPIEPALQACTADACDALLCVADPGDPSGLDLLGSVRENGLPVPVLIVTDNPDLTTAINAMRLGAVDYLVRPMATDQLERRVDDALLKGRGFRNMADAKRRVTELAQTAEALEVALAGHYPPSSSRLRPAQPISDAPSSAGGLEAALLARLSPREREVTRLLVQGNSVSDMATAFELSPNTVRNHVKSIFSKLQVHSQVALVSKLVGQSR